MSVCPFVSPSVCATPKEKIKISERYNVHLLPDNLRRCTKSDHWRAYKTALIENKGLQLGHKFNLIRPLLKKFRRNSAFKNL